MQHGAVRHSVAWCAEGAITKKQGPGCLAHRKTGCPQSLTLMSNRKPCAPAVHLPPPPPHRPWRCQHKYITLISISDVVRCSAPQCGVAWRGVVQCSVARCSAVWCGVVYCSGVWGVVYCSVVQYGSVQCSAAGCGAVWLQVPVSLNFSQTQASWYWGMQEG